MKNINQSIKFIKNILNQSTLKNQLSNYKTAFILGSGLGYLSQELTDVVEIKTSEIPNYPTSTVLGHKGSLIFGLLKGKPLLIISGRVHFYEGYSLKEVTYPIEILNALNIKNIILTNAAGGINSSFKAGDLMLITGYYDFLNQNIIKVFTEKLKDSICLNLNSKLHKEIREAAKDIKLDLKEGIYAAMTGPSFETPKEITFLAKQKADAIGMSTIPEIKKAQELGLNVAAISCISNLAAGISKIELTHEEVSETTNNIKHLFLDLLRSITEKLC